MVTSHLAMRLITKVEYTQRHFNSVPQYRIIGAILRNLQSIMNSNPKVGPKAEREGKIAAAKAEMYRRAVHLNPFPQLHRTLTPTPCKPTISTTFLVTPSILDALTTGFKAAETGCDLDCSAVVCEEEVKEALGRG